MECADGRYMVVQQGDMGVVVEYYNAKLERLSSQVLPAELPIFGGFYAMGGNYYLLTGQRNPDESPSVECFRLTKYDSSWKRLGSAGLFDCNTIYPLDCGARMVSVGKYLVVRASHVLYKTKDGLNHQTNCAIEFDTERMEVTDFNCSIGGAGYVSHSFNQFVEEEGGKIIGLDHGDAHPRAITLYEYGSDARTGKFTGLGERHNFFEFPGEKGLNYTGVTVGGFAVTDSTYLVAGTKIDFARFDLARIAAAGEEQGYLFTCVMDKTTKEVKTTLLIDEEDIENQYDGEYTLISNPHLVEVGKGRYMLLWMMNSDLFYAYIDENGQLVSEIMKGEGKLSDCVPIVTKGKVLWYTWKDDAMTFYCINLKNNSLSVKENLYEHRYEFKKRSGFKATLVCSECGAKKTVAIPKEIDIWFDESNDGWWGDFLYRMFEVGDAFGFSYPVEHEGEYSVSFLDPDMLKMEDVEVDAGRHFYLITVLKPGMTEITVYATYNPEISKTFQVKTVEYVEPVPDFTVGKKTTTSICLNWNPFVTWSDGYIVEQYKGGKWVRIKKFNTDMVGTFTVKKLKPKTTYKFRIKAYRKVNGKTYYSEYVTVTAKTK